MSHVDLTVLSLVRINTESIVFGGLPNGMILAFRDFLQMGKKTQK